MSNKFETTEAKRALLLNYKKNNSVPLIVDFTKDTDPLIRAESLLVLGELGNTELYSHIIPGLFDEDHHVRFCAADALGTLGSVYAIEPLIKAAQSNSEFVKCRAINALGRITSEESLDFLIFTLLNSNENIRQEAESALEQLLNLTACQDKLDYFFKEDSNRSEKFNKLYKQLQIQLKYGNLYD